MLDFPELVTRRADVKPATINESARTVEVIFSTGAEVRRMDLDGPYLERLSMDPAAVNLERLVGAVMLEHHKAVATPWRANTRHPKGELEMWPCGVAGFCRCPRIAGNPAPGMAAFPTR